MLDALFVKLYDIHYKKYSRVVTGESDGNVGGKSSTHPDPKNLLSNTCNNCKAVSRTDDRGQPVFIKVTFIIAV